MKARDARLFCREYAKNSSNVTTKVQIRRRQKQIKKKYIFFLDFWIIDLGWIHEGIQVRAKLGGGTKKLNIHKDTNLSSILETSTSLFYPDGKSPKGNIEEF